MAGIMEKMYGNQGGGSGGDSHNKGSFLTPAALREAYPTAEPGDFAIVESTDTIWVWDNDGSDWKDADQKGQVTSVNGQTGAVTVQATLVNQDNIKSVNGNSLLGSGNLELSTYLTYPAGWTTTGTTKAFCDAVAADTSAVEGKAYLGEVTFSDLPASMANGEVVVEIMDGTTAQNKVIVLTLTSGNTAPYMWKYTYWNGGSNVSGWVTCGDTLPSQSGNSGKFLTTDGTDASWSDKPLVNKGTASDSIVILGTSGGSQANVIGYRSSGSTGSSVIGHNCSLGQLSCGMGYEVKAGDGAVVIGQSSIANNYSVTIGSSAGPLYTTSNATFGIAIGRNAGLGNNTVSAIQLGPDRNSESRTFKVAFVETTNPWSAVNYKLLDADGTIPADRLPNAINKYSAMPTAASTNEGWIVQYTGADDAVAGLTHGYIYECKAQGTDPETYAWEAVEVQAGGGGGLPSQTGNSGKFLTTDGTDASWATVDTLPSQTGNAGKFLTTDGTDASWSNKPLVNTATVSGALTILGSPITDSSSWNCINIGPRSSATGSWYGLSVGYEAKSTGVQTNNKWVYCQAIGSYAQAIGTAASTKSVEYVLSIGYDARAQGYDKIQIMSNPDWQNTPNRSFYVKNYMLLDLSDGTIPEARLADTTNAQQGDVLTLDSNGNAVWQAGGGGGGSTALSLTLAAANWSNNTITVTATGVTASNNVIVSPAPASQSAYTTAGVMCTAQAADSLTFTCTTTPSSDLTVTVLII